MGFATSFCKHMRNRSFQYMVRSTYDLFEKDKPGRDSYSYNSLNQSKRVKKVREEVVHTPLDKNGRVCRAGSFCRCNGEEKRIVRTTPKMVVFADGTKRKASNVELLS